MNVNVTPVSSKSGNYTLITGADRAARNAKANEVAARYLAEGADSTTTAFGREFVRVIPSYN